MDNKRREEIVSIILSTLDGMSLDEIGPLLGLLALECSSKLPSDYHKKWRQRVIKIIAEEFI